MSIDVENSVCPHVTVLTGIFRLACWALKLKAFRDHVVDLRGLRVKLGWVAGWFCGGLW